jgi:hypothetical protein
MEAEGLVEDRIEMSGREVKRLEVLRQVVDRVIAQRQAAEKLGLCDRQVRRLLRRYAQQGAAGLVSRKRGHDPLVLVAVLGAVGIALALGQGRAGQRQRDGCEQSGQDFHLQASSSCWGGM